MDRGEKWNIIRKHKLCKFCLSKHIGDCKRKKVCGIEGCKFFHHTSLHRHSGSEDIQMSKRDINNKSVIQNDVIVNNTHNTQMKQILFKIIPIKIYGKDKTLNAFAFIDEGSSVSLVDESLVNELNVSGVPSPLCLRWTGGVERNERGSKKVRICISGGNKQPVVINAFTVKSLNLPMQSLDYKKISQRYKHLRNLPVDSYTNAVPQILIGLNHFNLGVSTKIHEGTPQEPIAVHTKLGWLIYGAATEENKPSKHFNFHMCNCIEEDNKLEKLVKTFYAIESIGISVKDPLLADKDKRALGLLKQFTKQKPSGHYEVPLLWKYDCIDMPDSYQMAFKRLVCLEKKLRQNNDHLSMFKETISKYLAKGYIRKLVSDEINNDSTNNRKIWYLPIFSVFNKNKPGKHRIVWDAAAKSNGVSLNSFLLKGPDLISSLPSILYKFRTKSVAVCGDIEEMFHQVHIRAEDQDVQRFLWRDCIEGKRPDIYVMEVMIFGATCAPSISQYIKNLNAENYKDKFPQASKSIQENHYVDDLLDSVDSPEEAIKLISDVSYIHKMAAFKIRNWVSNEKIVQQSTPLSKIESAKCLNIGEEKQIEKVLGIFWRHEEDIITFKIATWLNESCILALDKISTKREVLRLVMSIYDPLGLIGHIIMYVKILMQNIWRCKIDWDEQIPTDLSAKWNKWVKALPDIENLKIPRCYLRHLPNYDNIEIQLHTFVDASRDGYAAVCYLRLRKGSDIICSIIGSKTRVAPIKITSVPRLELMAALIGARLAKYITDNHNFKINEQFFWSDSKTVLSWLNSDHRKYSQFVAFRVTEILEFSSAREWRWISSKQNVADEATKWSKFPEISNSCRWLQGPEFLTCSDTEWPQVVAIPNLIDDERLHHSLKITKVDMIVDAQRFSKWYRLLRTIAYLLRFISKCRKICNNKSELTREELQDAENLLYRQAQSEQYFHEISQLKSNLKIPKSSDIYAKNPYLDKGLLRVYGRIDNADIPAEQKRPIILPRSSYITKLILMYYHEKFHHVNHETVINEVRQRFCISKLRAALKSVIRTCQMCKVKKAEPQSPQMGILPRARVASYVAPFTYTGVDFFGPIFVTVNRHKEKRYGCLFTCMTIRAVHIEVTHSLTTSSCILAIRNFMARRGIPHEFYSDNGTNFIGAERELREALAEVNKNQLIKTFTSRTTKWNFNPPASPHMGGAWERLVRSIKTILYKIITSRSHGDEVLVSTLIEIENIINSRPLVYVPINAENEEALTPNHFLIGSSSGMKPMTVCDDSGLILKQSWLTSQQHANVFWKKWLLEYLPSLTCRTKWHARPKPLSQGDLVIIVDPSLPRNVWLRGKVLETRLASDGQVRSAKVLTKQGIMERAATKLAILDVALQVESGFEGGSSHTAGGMLTLHPKS